MGLRPVALGRYDYDDYFAFNSLFEHDEQVLARHLQLPVLVADLGGTGRALVPSLSPNRRFWTVDPNTHMIVAQTLTENNIHDGDQVDPLLEQVESDIDTFYGDGAYDQWKVHDSLAEQEIEAIIPPRKNAKIKQHGNSSNEPLPRDEALRQIRREGRQGWKEAVDYRSVRSRLGRGGHEFMES